MFPIVLDDQDVEIRTARLAHICDILSQMTCRTRQVEGGRALSGVSAGKGHLLAWLVLVLVRPAVRRVAPRAGTTLIDALARTRDRTAPITRRLPSPGRRGFDGDHADEHEHAPALSSSKGSRTSCNSDPSSPYLSRSLRAKATFGR